MIRLDGNSLRLQDVVSVAREREKVELSKTTLDRVKSSYANLRKILATGKPVYGINTGYGIFAEKRIDHQDIQKLNRNLILSHAVGIGSELDLEVVRGAMLIRANALSKGFSGVRSEIIHTLIAMLNQPKASGQRSSSNCPSVLAAIYSTPVKSSSIMRLIVFEPPPPRPITFITGGRVSNGVCWTAFTGLTGMVTFIVHLSNNCVAILVPIPSIRSTRLPVWRRWLR